MSDVTYCHAVYGGKRIRLQFTIDLMRELEKARDSGPQAILTKLMSRRYEVDDIRETIRLAAIGGGMTPTDAFVMMSRYFDREPIHTSVSVATKPLIAFLFGFPRDEADAA